MAEPISNLPINTKSLSNQLFVTTDDKVYAGKDKYYLINPPDVFTPVQEVAASTITATAARTYGVQLNAAGQLVVNVPWVDTNTTYTNMTLAELNTGTVTTGRVISADTLTDWLTGKLPTVPDAVRVRSGSNAYLVGDITFAQGTGITLSQSGQTITITGTSAYTLPVATATVLGGIELFSNTVQSVAANAVTTTAGRTYGIQLNSAGQAVVNVPWEGGSSVSLETAGSATVGAVRYAGTTKTNGQFYGGTSNATNTTRLNYDGNFHCNNVVGSFQSDGRLKESVVRLDSALHKISKISGYSFKWKEGESYEGNDYGFIAQEIEDILPDAVITNKESGIKSIKMGNQITALLLEAIKELQEKVERLEAQYGIS